MIYLIIIVFLAGLFGGGYGVYQWEEGKIARAQQAQVEAQNAVDAAAREAEQEAANKIIDMNAAFEAGESNAKVITRTVYAKGQSYVASNAVFNLRECVVPPDGMQQLNSARAGVRTTTAAAGSAAAVPGAGTDSGRPTVDPVPATPEGHGAVGPVHPESRPADSSGQVPGLGVPTHPKPKHT